jgi:hypothetical protein
MSAIERENVNYIEAFQNVQPYNYWGTIIELLSLLLVSD